MQKKYNQNSHIRLMLEAIPAAVTLYDENNTLVDCNMETFKLFGFTNKAKFIKEYNKRFFDFSAEYQPCGTPATDKKEEVLRQVELQGRLQTEWTHLDINGEELPVSVTFTRIEIDGSPFNLVCDIDLREIKLAREKEAETERQSLKMEIARVEAALERELLKREEIPAGITKGSLKLDILANQAFVNDISLELANAEFKLLCLFVQNEGKLLDAELIYETIWTRPLVENKNAIRSSVKRLRQKIVPVGYNIITKRGKGYVFEKEQ